MTKEELQEENKKQKELLEEIRNITQSYVPLNAGDITSNIKDYIKILNILKKYIGVEQNKGLKLGYDIFDLSRHIEGIYITPITKEQYEILKEWLENGKTK